MITSDSIVENISLELIGSWRSGIVEDDNPGISLWEIDELKKGLPTKKGVLAIYSWKEETAVGQPWQGLPSIPKCSTKTT